MTKLTFKKSNIGIGKRKKSIARVFLISGTGKLTINRISGDQYLQHNKTYLKSIQFPLEKLNLTGAGRSRYRCSARWPPGCWLSP